MIVPSRPPSEEVLEAFGGSESLHLLAGGEGLTYRAGDIVLKPADEGSEHLAEIEQNISATAEFRFPKPVRSRRGGWVYQGWSAKEFAEGQHEPGRWSEQIDTCFAFHRALSDIPRPRFLHRYNSAWSIADQVAFGETEIDHHPKVAPIVGRLRQVLRPVGAKSQLVHGDSGGNLLYADGPTPRCHRPLTILEACRIRPWRCRCRRDGGRRRRPGTHRPGTAHRGLYSATRQGGAIQRSGNRAEEHGRLRHRSRRRLSRPSLSCRRRNLLAN